jgi:hypothetical protein
MLAKKPIMPLAILLAATIAHLYAAIPNDVWDQGLGKAGFTRDEREFTLSFTGPTARGSSAEALALRIRDALLPALGQDIWQVSRELNQPYTLRDFSPTTVIFFDIYFDALDPTLGFGEINYQWELEYRIRQRFDNWRAFEDYAAGRASRPDRHELMAKTDRRWIGEGLSTVNEHRTEGLGFLLGHDLAARGIDVLLNAAATGVVGQNISVASIELVNALNTRAGMPLSWDYRPKLCLVTERQRQHLVINNTDTFIVSLDRVNVHESGPLLDHLRGMRGMPTAVGTFTSLDVEFERNISQSVDDRMRALYLEDQATVVRIIRERLDDGSGDLRITGETETKYRKATNIIMLAQLSRIFQQWGLPPFFFRNFFGRF